MSLALTPAQVNQLQNLLIAEDFTAGYELMKAWTADSTDPDVQLVHTWLRGVGHYISSDDRFRYRAVCS